MKSAFIAAASLAAVISLPMVAQAANSATDANAPVPPLRHDSAFSDYRRDEDIDRADWREVNRVVDDASRKGGGHAGHGATPAASKPVEPQRGMGDGGMNHGPMNDGSQGGMK